MKRTWAQAQKEYGQLGIIESVSLRNFMCHDNLNFDFHPHINFIVGRNGSGKSAVLTGVILALGGKSGATGRYSNIKGFIKTGKSSATVSVTLKNCGSEAYKPEEFGSKIIVERHFTSDGTSSYKLKSEGGRIVSSSKEELTNVLNVMDIQIENPITVLTQETSRNFLVSKNSKADKLFSLFYTGTGLAKVHDDYNRAVAQKNEAKMELINKKSILPDMEKAIKKVKSLLDKSSKLTELKKELLWAGVIEFEKKRDEAQKAADGVKKDFADLKKKLDTYEAQLPGVSQNILTSAADRRTSNDKMGAIRVELNELNQKKSVLSSEIRQLLGTSSSHEREVKKFSTEIQSIQKIIDEVKIKNQTNIDESKLHHENIVNGLKAEIEKIEYQIRELEARKVAIQESYSSTAKKVDVCQAELQEINSSKKTVALERGQLIQGMANRVNVFGNEMVHVLREIKKATESGAFQYAPKGPIGLFINVKQPEWTFAVQECLKPRFLKTFLCDNYRDYDLLSKIFNKYYQQNPPSIITTKFVYQVHDVTPHKTVSDHPTLLDMLDIEDPVVTNSLIDQSQIENILLINDQDQALKLMLYQPPRTCRFAYTPNGDQYCHSPYRYYSCRNTNQICMLKKVNADDISKKEEQLRVLDQIELEKNMDKERLSQQLNLHEQERVKNDNTITLLRIKLNQLHMELNNVENSYEEPKDINCLQSDLDHLLTEKQGHEERLATCKVALDLKNRELYELDKNIEELKRNLQIESRTYHSLSEKFDESEAKKEKLETAIKKLKDQLGKIQPVLEQKENDLANATATVDMAIANALEVGPRIDTTRSSETIRQLIKEIQKHVEKQKSSDRQDLLNQYEERREALSKAKKELQRQEQINSRLEQMMAKRFQEFQKICKNTSVSLTCCFTTLLKENNFHGHPAVNFEHRTLEIVAKPMKMNAKRDGKNNLAQLSGGERSYVTIAFLLSLWDRIRMPFRILDEYDVFMDSNNRHISIHLLINTAKANRKVQYIFLSPLELPQIDDSEDVKIHKMPDPRK